MKKHTPKNSFAKKIRGFFYTKVSSILFISITCLASLIGATVVFAQTPCNPTGFLSICYRLDAAGSGGLNFGTLSSEMIHGLPFTIENEHPTNDYFIPTKSPAEWLSFLNIAKHTGAADPLDVKVCIPGYDSNWTNGFGVPGCNVVCDGLTMTDARDNQTYGTVAIGDKCWFTEDLVYEGPVGDPFFLNPTQKAALDNFPDNFNFSHVIGTKKTSYNNSWFDMNWLTATVTNGNNVSASDLATVKALCGSIVGGTFAPGNMDYTIKKQVIRGGGNNVSGNYIVTCTANGGSTSKKFLYAPAGPLYHSAVVLDNLCPVGWHVPTDQEFREMEFMMGMDWLDSMMWSYGNHTFAGPTGTFNQLGLNQVIGGGNLGTGSGLSFQLFGPGPASTGTANVATNQLTLQGATNLGNIGTSQTVPPPTFSNFPTGALPTDAITHHRPISHATMVGGGAGDLLQKMGWKTGDHRYFMRNRINDNTSVRHLARYIRGNRSTFGISLFDTPGYSPTSQDQYTHFYRSTAGSGAVDVLMTQHPALFLGDWLFDTVEAQAQPINPEWWGDQGTINQQKRKIRCVKDKITSPAVKRWAVTAWDNGGSCTGTETRNRKCFIGDYEVHEMHCINSKLATPAVTRMVNCNAPGGTGTSGTGTGGNSGSGQNYNFVQ